VEGEITVPEKARMLFVPQKPYLPLGTLRHALCYPESADVSGAQLREVLSLCGLDFLAPRLEESDQWSNILSLGEQQRVAFARVLLARPEFLFLDEATSALDEAAEAHFYELIKARLPHVALVSVGHHESLRKWHTKEVALGK
jgi:putative ATP-binding cassette transporter